MILAFGLLPIALVTYYYDVLPHRFVIQWDAFGNTTVIGTRARTVLMVANMAGVIALLGIALAIWQNRTLVTLGMRRAFLGLNLAQIVAINLTCAMIVNDALGLKLSLKPTIPPAMAVVLFAAGVLCRRIDQNQRNAYARGAAIVLAISGILLLAYSALAINAVVGYYASAFGLLAMLALALPQGAR